MVQSERMQAPDENPPQPKTSAELRCGTPPIPPENGPPNAVATGSGEDGDESVIRVETEKQALEIIREQGYFVTKISANK